MTARPQPRGQDLEAAAHFNRHFACACTNFVVLMLLFSFDIFGGIAQAPNEMNLIVDRPNRREVNRYWRARRQQALYRAASLLWAQGVSMEQAINIVESAMKEAGEL